MAETKDLDDLVARTEGPRPWRRLFHAASGVALVAALVYLDPPYAVAAGVLGGLTVLLFLGEAARFAIPPLNRLFFRLFRPLASPREARGPSSATWYVLGCFLAVSIFPQGVWVPAILVLALADPLASYVGGRWGRRRLGTGTVEGSLVFLAAATLILLPFSGGPVTALIVAGVVTAVEPLPWPLDDNLVIPLLSGGVLWSLLPLGV